MILVGCPLQFRLWRYNFKKKKEKLGQGYAKNLHMANPSLICGSPDPCQKWPLIAEPGASARDCRMWPPNQNKWNKNLKATKKEK